MITIDITVNEQTAKLSIGGHGQAVLEEDLLPDIMMGTPDLKDKTQADALSKLISELLKGFVRERARLWD